MARRRSRRGARRGRSYARKARSFGGGKKGGIGINLSMEYLIGLGASFFLKDDSGAITKAATIGAIAPVTGIGKIKAASQGYMSGKLIQAYTGFGLNLGGSSKTSGNVV